MCCSAQVREFKEAFGFFNAQNPRDTELSAGDVYDVMTRFEPHKDIDIKVRHAQPSRPQALLASLARPSVRARLLTPPRRMCAGGRGADPRG
jgi:hypothetical protein